MYAKSNFCFFRNVWKSLSNCVWTFSLITEPYGSNLSMILFSLSPINKLKWAPLVGYSILNGIIKNLFLQVLINLDNVFNPPS